MWVCSFVDNASLFLKFLGTRRNEVPELITHLAAGGTAGSLKARMQALRQVQTQALNRLGLHFLSNCGLTRMPGGCIVAGAAALERVDGVPPVSWTPNPLGEWRTRCQEQDELIHPSFASR